jgi:hypothetical protein
MPDLLAALDAFLQEHRRCGDLDAELVAKRVDVILTWGTPLKAKQATKTIPIVMGAIGDPICVGRGLESGTTRRQRDRFILAN